MALDSPHWQWQGTPALQATASTQQEEISQLILQVDTAYIGAWQYTLLQNIIAGYSITLQIYIP